MKSLKIIAKIATLFLLMVMSQNAMAQSGPSKEDRGAKKMEMMKAELNLSDDQAAKMEAIHEKYKGEMKALKEAETHDREAFKKIKMAQHEEVKTILNEEQVNKLEEMHAQRKMHRRDRHHKRGGCEGDRGACKGKKGFHGKEHSEMRQEMKAYAKENVFPTLKEKRAELERYINDQDKAKIESFRAQMKAMKGQKKAFRKSFDKGEKPDWANISEEDRAKMKEMREKHKAMRGEVRDLADTYEEQMKGIKEDINPQIEQWKNDMKEIAKKHHPEMGDKMEKYGKFDHKMMKKFAGPKFLLMDPNATDDWMDEMEGTINQNKTAVKSVNVFPNPSIKANTINYEVMQEGNVKIELIDREGNLIKLISNEYKSVGEYQEDVELGNLRGVIHFYRITDVLGSQTVRFVVGK